MLTPRSRVTTCAYKRVFSMKSKRRILQKVLTSMLILSFSLQLVMPVKAADYILGFVIKKQPIYSIAQEDSTILGYASKGDIVKIYMTNGNFYKIRVGSRFGYIKQSKVLVGKQLKQYVVQHPSIFPKVATVLKDSTALYETQKSKSPKMYFDKGTKIVAESVDNTWTKVSVEGKPFWIKSSNIEVVFNLEPTEYQVSYNEISYSYGDEELQVIADALKADGSVKAQLAAYGLQFVGNPYVWGGTSLTGGADCSGFVQSIYKVFGYTIPRVSYNQAEFGKRVGLDELEPGDLVFYKTERGYRVSKSGIGHVAMYIGNGLIVQAQDSEHGIVVSPVDFIKPAWACRIIKEG